jgi:hypothetical protein
LTEKSDPTLKAFANPVWPTLSALNFPFVSYVPGLSQAPTAGLKFANAFGVISI